ncbi:hypothetical protein STCU_09915 [Strigomonas culicis]|uniref:Uncharacterized protein n=1 Tax=Strigomonas culicis TaxID=28005 RepID=S9TPP2_9TRYP|nr:hypothetical protein STCU_09915 [Strigomonas culicis]|eukprot:EPY18433.1 hypothetical protein STCU_09915 [Strigomonas culicis]
MGGSSSLTSSVLCGGQKNSTVTVLAKKKTSAEAQPGDPDDDCTVVPVEAQTNTSSEGAAPVTEGGGPLPAGVAASSLPPQTVAAAETTQEPSAAPRIQREPPAVRLSPLTEADDAASAPPPLHLCQTQVYSETPGDSATTQHVSRWLARPAALDARQLVGFQPLPPTSTALPRANSLRQERSGSFSDSLNSSIVEFFETNHRFYVKAHCKNPLVLSEGALTRSGEDGGVSPTVRGSTGSNQTPVASETNAPCVGGGEQPSPHKDGVGSAPGGLNAMNEDHSEESAGTALGPCAAS